MQASAFETKKTHMHTFIDMVHIHSPLNERDRLMKRGGKLKAMWYPLIFALPLESE